MAGRMRGGREGEVLVKNSWTNETGITKSFSSNLFSVNSVAFHFPRIKKRQPQ